MLSLIFQLEGGRRAGEARRLMSDVREHPLYKRALECTTEELDLCGESACLAACGAGLCAFRSGGHASFGRWRVCVRSGGRV